MKKYIYIKMSSEINSKKKKKIRKNNYIEDSEDDMDDIKEKKSPKKTKKMKKIQTEIFSNDENQNSENINGEDNLISKPKKKKKVKKKARKITDEDDTKELNSDNKNELNEMESNENFSIKDEEVSKPKKKKKKKKKSKPLSKEDSIYSDNERMRPKTSRPKKTEKLKKKISKSGINKSTNDDILNNSDNEDIKKGKNKKEDILEEEKEQKIGRDKKRKKSKKSDKRTADQIFLDNIGKKINMKNKNQVNLTKSTILNIFSTKTIIKVDNDYEEEKNRQDEDKEEEKENLENSEAFADLLVKINDLDYKGYNYKLSKNDYFKRKPNDSPITTILNSEDAAIKKCEELMQSLGDSMGRWVDPDFGPQENDNGKGNRKSIFGDLGSSESLGINPEYIEWYSITDINDEATFFYDGTESNDVMQGALGDCWFISALSVIATKDYLLRGEFNKNILEDGKIDEEEIKMMSEGIYPPIFHSFSTKGIYCFRFFKNFKWRYVIIDDRLPCHAVYNQNQTKKLIFAHCRQDNEFWVPLIEKAYAKIHGSYYALVSGCIDDGLVDMTGLVSKKILKDNEILTNQKRINDLWDLLINYSSVKFDNELFTQAGKKVTSKYYTRNKSMMGCSVEPTGRNKEMEVSMQGHKIGIIAGHAYSILDAFEIPKARSTKPRKTSRLLRLRNPWGNYEWNGKWCDNSEEVIKNKERIENILNKKYADTSEKIDFSKNDGTFLMRFSDFRKIFNNIFFCQNFPPNFYGVRFYDEWTKENSGGLPLHGTNEEFKNFFKNPQYYFQIKKSGKIIISLLQNDGRLYGAKFPFPEYVKRVCLLVFKAKGENPLNSFDGRIDQTVIAQRRDLSLELNLEKGSYIAIPSLKDKGECATFKMEFYFEDELLQNTKNNKFSFDQLKYTTIKRLGGSEKCELINEYISSEVQMASQNKLDFIMSAFQYSLKNNEENNKPNNNKGFSLNKSYEDEDF